MRKTVSGMLAVVALVVASDLTAQTCGGVNSCSVTVDASVAVPALVSLNLGAGSITLTPPTVADFGSFVQDNGPSFTVKANRSWSLSVHTTATTDWTYVGTAGGVKPIGDLTWSNTSTGTYVAVTNTAAAIVTNQAKTNGASPTLFFRTHWAAAFDDPRNAAGTFTIPLMFTLSAP
ncbi:MAG: hypothetical protein ACREMQ_23025 [Longimicrobiales bacterium]